MLPLDDPDIGDVNVWIIYLRYRLVPVNMRQKNVRTALAVYPPRGMPWYEFFLRRT